jgi:hypothetical protein
MSLTYNSLPKKYGKKYLQRTKKSPSKLKIFNQEFMKNANDQLVPLSNLKLCKSKKRQTEHFFPLPPFHSGELFSILKTKISLPTKIGNFQMKTKSRNNFPLCLLKQTPFDFHLESYPSSKLRGQM